MPANKKFKSKQLSKDVMQKRYDERLTLREASKQAKGSTVNSFFRVESNQPITIETLVIICNWLKVPVQTYF